jgi:hypothetical protein
LLERLQSDPCDGDDERRHDHRDDDVATRAELDVALTVAHRLPPA